jgi:hypothetical protein
MMLDDENKLIQALRNEIDGPAPAVRTQLSDIVPRGMRRRRIRQTSSVAAAVAVVVGLGFAATTINGKPTSTDDPAVSTTTLSTTVNAQATWDRADHLPTRTPYRTWSPAATAPRPSDAPALSIPMCSSPAPYNGGAGTIAVPPEFRDRVAAAVRAVAAGTKTGPVMPSGTGKYTVVEFDVSDSGGTGSVRVNAAQFAGDPVRAADAQAFDRNNCEPPRRTVLADNTVMQIYGIIPSEPFQSLTRSLRVFLPTGVVVDITVQNWGSPDFVRIKGTDTVNRSGKGRPTLPLTELQLSQVAERLMGN